MTSNKNQPQSELRGQLELARERVEYDVDAGLRRHRELVTRGVPAPDWAEGLHVPRALWRARALTGMTVLVLGGAAFLAVRPTSNVAPSAVRAPAAQPRSLTQRVPGREDATANTFSTSSAHDSADGQAGPAALGRASNRGAALANAPVATLDSAPREALIDGRRAPAGPLALAGPTPVLRRPVRSPRFPASASATAAPRDVIAELAAGDSLDLSRAQAAPTRSASRGEAASNRPSADHGGERAAVNSGRFVASPRAPVIVDERPAVVVEMQELTRAEGLLAKDPGAALSLVRSSIAKHPGGFLEQERRYVEVMAMLGLRRVEEARLLGREFVRAYPQSPFRRRVDAAITDAIRGQ